MPRDPDRDLEDADERRIRDLLAAVEVSAPSVLQARIAELNNASAAPRRRLYALRLRLPAGRPALALGSLCAAAIAAVIAVSLSGGGGAPLTALRTADLALAPMKAPAPRSLTAAGTRLVFPDWSSRGWPSVGMRSDRVGGRVVTTEFYSSYPAGTIGYAIVSGAPLRWGTGGGRVVTSGHGFYRLASFSGKRVVVWVQQGHTCVLASRTVAAADLLALAEAEDANTTAASNSPASTGVGWLPM
jgi:hypothetical protein